ncbi:MAG: GNAT family N-acetyltransferase [Candidatus Aminicenantes bacterium]|nr:GNAT family N-acetyltransferase [Candidatus Aminicenantes bacterium]
MREKTVVEIAEFNRYENVKSQWLELNSAYRQGELSVDYELHLELWNRYRQFRGDKLKILVGSEKGVVFAVLPFIHARPTPVSLPIWVYGEEQIIAREYFSRPDRIHLMLDAFPVNETTDLSCFYLPMQPEKFATASGRIIDLKASDEDYLASLNSKHRKAIRRNHTINADLVVEVRQTIHEEGIQPLVRQYLEYWKQKKAGLPAEDVIDSREKLNMDLDILRRAQRLRKLISLYVYLEKRLVAVNFAVRRGADRVDDYLTLRDTGSAFYERGLGNFCVWKNMQVCRSRGIRYYDLSDFPGEYKNKFVNTEQFYYYFPGGSRLDHKSRAQSKSKREHNREVGNGFQG